jgi:hypothetical protein
VTLPDLDLLKELPTVHVCAGPTACPFDGDEAEANMQAGCPRCQRIAIHPDGSETVYHLPAN